MKKVVLLLCTMFLIYSTVSGVVRAESKYKYSKNTNLSTWLWDASKIVEYPDEIIENLINHDVKLVLLQIDIAVDTKYYRSFISKATANGIKVEALDGAPQWVAKNGVKLQQTFFDWLNNYQKTASINEGFKGIHLDVEPYELDQYTGNENEILEAYQTLIIKFKRQASKLNLNFGIDIPFWFYGVQYQNKYGTGNIAEWLCQHVKFMTIMAYRDIAEGADGIISISAAEMKMFSKYSVKGTIAVETGRLANPYQFVTFYEEGKNYMDQQLELVYESYKTHPEFNGIAVHYYDSWMAMK